MALKRKLLTIAGVLVVLVLVYGLKVWHAMGVCDDAGGQWEGGDCVFHEKSHEQSHEKNAAVGGSG